MVFSLLQGRQTWHIRSYSRDQVQGISKIQSWLFLWPRSTLMLKTRSPFPLFLYQYILDVFTRRQYSRALSPQKWNTTSLHPEQFEAKEHEKKIRCFNMVQCIPRNSQPKYMFLLSHIKSIFKDDRQIAKNPQEQ